MFLANTDRGLQFLRPSGWRFRLRKKLQWINPNPNDMRLTIVNKSAGEVVGASCPNPILLTATPMEEPGVERQDLPPCEPSSLALIPVKGLVKGRSRPARDLTTGLSGRLQHRLWETIEVSCSSTREDHPEGHQTEIAGEDPSSPVPIQDEDSPDDVQPAVDEVGPAPREKPCNNDSTGGDSANGATCISAGPPSYAELEEMLRQIPPGSDVNLPSTKMFETTKMV